ncbi:flagellar biosynthesis regulator FlaF [Aestuariispira insulae]|uniref:Flagellar protein FlaF n=1 Tax=Aestuariispira insulae TaxID=1461337 RepID=A0A3D9HSE2_9PROT|nr:flagellar biosynthesis regulator FlaF [Aestuariispira insulae]RED52433.1 flagellar protein FlaF [Aestuariispira insulae]
MNNPYAKQQQSALQHATPQAAEGWALIEMARRLDSAVQEPVDEQKILEMTRLNWRIWTIIQSELVDPECQIPREIRENLINLSNFIDKRSADIIAAPAPEKLAVLININRQIGAGLMETPSEDQNATADQGDQPAEGSQTASPPDAEALRKITDQEA